MCTSQAYPTLTPPFARGAAWQIKAQAGLNEPHIISITDASSEEVRAFALGLGFGFGFGLARDPPTLSTTPLLFLGRSCG